MSMRSSSRTLASNINKPQITRIHADLNWSQICVFLRLSAAKFLNGMRFGVEDHVIEVERVRWREEQVEVFESLREDEALHRVSLLFRHDALQRRIALVSA